MDSKEMAPGDIERRSFEIITEELGGGGRPPPPQTFESRKTGGAARSRRSKSPS